MIDTYAHLRNKGVDKMEAVLETCRERVRPVMPTAVTAILGVLPIAFGVNLALLSHEVTIGAPSTQWWIALSSAIVFGLAFSTILTLVVTPPRSTIFTRDNESLRPVTSSPALADGCGHGCAGKRRKRQPPRRSTRPPNWPGNRSVSNPCPRNCPTMSGRSPRRQSRLTAQARVARAR
ncbi:MAG: efflux RND transporter permease subunit [Hyphomicrobiales bacterium]